MLDAPLQKFLAQLLQIGGVDIEARRNEELEAFEKLVQARVTKKIVERATAQERAKLEEGQGRGRDARKTADALVKRLSESGEFEKISLAEAQALLSEKFTDLLSNMDQGQKDALRDAAEELRRSYPQSSVGV